MGKEFDDTPNALSSLRTVSAALNFFDPHIKPSGFRWNMSNDHERPANTLVPDPHTVEIRDLRALSVAQRVEEGLTLEKAGFEILKGWGNNDKEIEKAWKARKWDDNEWIESDYYAYVKQ
jgi:hypothetical protein